MSEKFAILFPGQGAQYSGMGRDIIDSKLFGSEVYASLDKYISPDTAKIILEANEENISKTRYAQLAIFLNSILLFEEVKKLGIDIVSSVGLSLGEYTALSASGMLSLEDAIKLVDVRGKVMSDGAAGKGSMIAVMKSDVETIESIIRDIKSQSNRKDIVLSICNLNSPAQIVVGGDFEALDQFELRSKDYGIKRTVRIDVEGPFHTDVLRESAEIFGEKLSEVEFSNSIFDVYSNVDGHSYKDIEDDKLKVIDNLKRQMYSPVRFEDCIKNVIANGCSNFIEIGPGKSLTGFVKKIDKKCKVYNVQCLEDIESLKREIED